MTQVAYTQYPTHLPEVELEDRRVLARFKYLDAPLPSALRRSLYSAVFKLNSVFAGSWAVPNARSSTIPVLLFNVRSAPNVMEILQTFYRSLGYSWW